MYLGAVGADGDVLAIRGPGEGGDVVVLGAGCAQVRDGAGACVPQVHRAAQRHRHLRQG